ncbi:TonB-dependent receptor [Halieaceae bacterium IMCC14734]|uniref:TonB-dependent receptor n=1 Tax=Candidatus Litorirhabdus singularis TaxID=2518993 RepID=A0ABT3TMI3_9GAMM|nr:TonB-dependent receptor [Candidatus Litorirhabdus singularis]MCX2982604.1 TonB-dependent receptor [Candidatus Litorirhabdus singularis]
MPTSRTLFPALVLGSAIMAPMPLAVAAQSTALEEVLVTARKREEDLQSTPISITAITAATIEDAALTDLRSIQEMTPGLSMQVSSDGSGSTLAAFIRGVGQSDFAVTVDPGVGTYIDGVYLARNIGANFEFNDIEQITVLRGPQGTLFGRNTIGGAISVTTRAPSGDNNLSVEAGVGDYGHKSGKIYMEFPLVEDKLAASISVIRKESDGWQKRSRGDDAGDQDLWGIRAHLNWNVTENFTSHLVIDGVEQDQNIYPRVLADFDSNQVFPFFYNTFVGDCCNETGDIDRSDASQKTKDELSSSGASWINTWNMNGGMTLKSTTGYRKMDTDILRDSDNDPQDYFSVGTQFEQDQFSQEFVLNGLAFNDRLDWVVGAYYFKESAKHDTQVNVATGLYEALVGLPLSVVDPETGVPLAFFAQPLDLTLRYEREQDVENIALFAHTSFSLTDDLRLILAGRYTQEEKDFELYSYKEASQSPIVAPGPTDPASCSDVTAQGPGSFYSCKDDWSEFSPKVGLDYQLNDEMMTYFHVSRGFRSGGFNGRPTSAADVSVVDPETLTSFELGFKSEWMDNRLRMNGAIFYNEYEDQQILVNRPSSIAAGGLALVVDNAAESELKGFELEITAVPTDGLTLIAGASYVDPEFKEFDILVPDPSDPTGGTIIVEDASDRPFASVPEWQGNLGAQYEFALGGMGNMRLRADMVYKDDVFYTNDTQAATFDLLHADAYTVFNAGITYISPSDKWQLALVGKNLTDEREINGGFSVDAFGTTDVSTLAPRMYFLNFKFHTN